MSKSLLVHSSAILAAASERFHAEFVRRVVVNGRGTVETTNTTADDLKKKSGGNVILFETLKSGLGTLYPLPHGRLLGSMTCLSRRLV